MRPRSRTHAASILATETVTHIRYNDANETLQPPYAQLLNCHNTGRNEVRHHGSFRAAEDLTIDEICSFQRLFDAWVTGLPFGDLERYPGENTTNNRYYNKKNINESNKSYINNFLYKLVYQGLMTIKQHGFWVANLASYKKNGLFYPLVENFVNGLEEKGFYRYFRPINIGLIYFQNNYNDSRTNIPASHIFVLQRTGEHYREALPRNVSHAPMAIPAIEARPDLTSTAMEDVEEIKTEDTSTNNDSIITAPNLYFFPPLILLPLSTQNMAMDSEEETETDESDSEDSDTKMVDDEPMLSSTNRHSQPPAREQDRHSSLATSSFYYQQTDSDESDAEDNDTKMVDDSMLSNNNRHSQPAAGDQHRHYRLATSTFYSRKKEKPPLSSGNRKQRASTYTKN